MKKVIGYLRERKKILLYGIILLFLFYGLINLHRVSLIDWDEGVYATQAEWIGSLGTAGKPFNFQTPPLYQIIISVLYKIFGVYGWVLSLISIIFSSLTIYVLFRIAEIIYSQKEAIYASLLFIFTEFFLFFSKSGLCDATFLFFFCTSILFFLKGLKSSKTINFYLAGIFVTLSLYTKYSAPPMLIFFIIIGLLNSRNKIHNWLFPSVILPIILFMPYLFIFIEVVKIPQIGARHLHLVSFNHYKFLFYLLIFSPFPLIYSILYPIFWRKFTKLEIYILIIIFVYFSLLGFYYPFFRLAYPLIPLLSIIAGKFIYNTGKIKNLLLLSSIIFSIILCHKTLSYKSDVPEKIGTTVNNLCQNNDIKYIYCLTPPNIYFYIEGNPVIPEGHPWINIGKNFPRLLEARKLIKHNKNELLNENKTLLIHLTLFDSLKKKNVDIYNSSKRIESIEFVDAPVYYKDIYNLQKDNPQIYEIYLLDHEILGDKVNELWEFGFHHQVQVIYK